MSRNRIGCRAFGSKAESENPMTRKSDKFSKPPYKTNVFVSRNWSRDDRSTCIEMFYFIID